MSLLLSLEKELINNIKMTNNFRWVYHIFIFTLYIISLTSASAGDRSAFYQNCVKNSVATKCTADGQEYNLDIIPQVDIYTKLLWNCLDDCKYNCMWRTVEVFQEQRFRIPKFHGKWPFKRIFGAQEPASAFASLLNLIVTLYMSSKIYQKINVRTTPVVVLWYIFIGVMVNGWIWSTVFHTRDTPFNEFMDYTCALSMVMAMYVAAIVRAFYGSRKILAIILLPSIVLYLNHVVYLYSGNIDYEYNIVFNGIFAAAGLLTWLIWANVQYFRGKYYMVQMVGFPFLSGFAMAFEMYDFPPVWGWDTHALWHLSTALLSIVFYRFVLDDLRYIQIYNSRKLSKIA